MWAHRVMAELIESAIKDSNLERVIIVAFFGFLALTVLIGVFL